MPATIEPATRSALLRALVLFIVTHGVALLTMALVLGRGMDPGAASVADRMAWISTHETEWRLGWLPWQLSAASDVAVCIALLGWARGDAVATRLAMAALAFDLVGAVPEQWAEWRLVTVFVETSRGDPDEWRSAWAVYAGLTGVWANFAYTAMTACWMVIAARRLGRVVTHVGFEAAVVVLFVVSGALTWLAVLGETDAEVARWFFASTLANGIGFPALIAWTCVLAFRIRESSASSG